MKSVVLTTISMFLFYLANSQVKIEVARDTSNYSKIRNEIEVQNIFLKLDSNDVAAYFKRANLYYALEEYDNCINEQNKILNRFPIYASEAYSNRGMCYSFLKKYKLAISDLSKAKDLSPKDPISYLNLAYVKSMSKDYKSAISLLDTALQLNPFYAKAYVNRGVAKGDLGAYQEAVDDISEALKIDSNYVEAYLNRAYDHFKLNQFDSSISDYNKAKKLAPLLECSGFYENRALVFEKKGDFINAKLDYDMAKRLKKR